MDNITLKIGKREIPLRFRMNQFIELEEELGNLGEIREKLTTDRHRLKNLIFCIRVLGNAGLKAAGKEPDLTDEELREIMEPHQLMAYQVAVLGCLSKENKSEAQQERDENTERDLVLEEIDAKKDPVNSHTGE